MEFLRIHGDNIVECKRALELLSRALIGNTKLVDSPPYAPIFEILIEEKLQYKVQLIPGYGRWGFSFPEYLRGRGARLREATDAIITKVAGLDDNFVLEDPVVSFEFCGALPAGNNAWQRTGRALAMAEADLPYFYYAELGGLELDSNRNAKAPRWPNPLVPFAYIETGDVLGTLTLPIYLKSPTASNEVIRPYEQVIDNDESLVVLSSLVTGSNSDAAVQSLRKKAIGAVKQLANQRKRKDTLKGDEWEQFGALSAGTAKAEWLIQKSMTWKKKLGIKGLTKSFHQLLKKTQQIGCVAPGATDIPFCILPGNKRKSFLKLLKEIYGERVSIEFSSWLSEGKNNVILVWVAGFKPKGDDSRPDRGLTPLARMIFGFNDIDLISIVYGPAKAATWNRVKNDPERLARENGLWEALIGLSDGIIVDSATSVGLDPNTFLFKKGEEQSNEIKLKSHKAICPQFGEQDIDTVVHLAFAALNHVGCFEGMCNPPGGDWSGLSYYKQAAETEYRWTSLPRVSGDNSKRPDHVIQIDATLMTILSIESKDTAEKLETGIGPRLVRYVLDLTSSPPSVSRSNGNDWIPHNSGSVRLPHKFISCGAFQYKSGQSLEDAIDRAQVDLVMSVEFDSENESAVLHLKAKDSAAAIVSFLREHQGSLPGRVKIQIH